MYEFIMSINWTSVINTVLMILSPLILEMFTGIFRAISHFLKAKYEDNFYVRFLMDVAEVMASIWQQEAQTLKEMYNDGVITEEEWKTHGARLKKLAVEKILERLKRYPEAFRESFGKRVEDAVEAWLEKNKRVQKMMDYLKNKKNPVGVDMAKLAEEASKDITPVDPSLSELIPEGSPDVVSDILPEVSEPKD